MRRNSASPRAAGLSISREPVNNDPPAQAAEIARTIAWLRTPAAIRERAGRLSTAAEQGALDHFLLDPDRLDAAAAYVAEVIRADHPRLDVPYHSRWRHFAAGGADRWSDLAAGFRHLPPDEVARIRFDLVTVSVLLDAGAGPAWRYHDSATGMDLSRSEGLAVASLRLLAAGAFSIRPEQLLRADAEALTSVTEATVAEGFQANDRNPLLGLEGRIALLRGLGAALRTTPELFGAESPRIGGLFDYLAAEARGRRLPADKILEAVLAGFGSIWPGRLILGGINLGDVWHHGSLAADDLSDGLIPFHKLSQWLSYSLIEPLEEAGITVTDLDALTGLAEYRNGGLLIDLGVLLPKHAGVTGEAHTVDSELVVEWRGLTVTLLDRLAERVRAQLGLSAEDFPLAKVLEGGTWLAGRRIAAERREDGGPPIRIDSDGTVF